MILLLGLQSRLPKLDNHLFWARMLKSTVALLISALCTLSQRPTIRAINLFGELPDIETTFQEALSTSLNFATRWTLMVFCPHHSMLAVSALACMANITAITTIQIS